MNAQQNNNRPTAYWGASELPSPLAVGDIIDVPASAPAVQDQGRLSHAGRWQIIAVFSISEDDQWYFRASPLRENGSVDFEQVSGRLHWLRDLNYLQGYTLVQTNDPEGLQKRESLLANGWNADEAYAEKAHRAFGIVSSLAHSLADHDLQEKALQAQHLLQELTTSLQDNARARSE